MKMFRVVILLNLLITLIFVSNMQNLSAQKWQGSVNLGGNFYKGNVNKQDYNLKLNIFHKDSLFEYSTDAIALYSYADTLQINKELVFVQTFDWKPKYKFSPFLSLTTYSNGFKGYKLKAGGFVGLKYTFWETKTGKYSLSVAWQYEHEIYSPDNDGVIKSEKDIQRLSLRFKFKQQLFSNLSIENTTFYKPELKDFDNYLLDSKSSLKIDIDKNFAFGVAYQYQFNSKPPNLGILKTDQILLFSFTVVFKSKN